MISMMVLGIILVRLIDKQTFGTYRQVKMVYLFLAGVVSLQLSESLYYFIPKFGLEHRRTIVTQTFLFTMALSFIIGAAMFFGAEFIARRFHNPGLVPLLRIFSLYPFVERALKLVPAFMISIDRPIRAGVYTLTMTICHIGIVVIMVGAGFGLRAVMLSIVLITSIVALVGCIDMVRFSPFKNWRIDLSLLKEQFHYTWPLLATTIVGTINLQYGKILISSFFEPSTYAVYSCGAIQLPIVGMVTVSVAAAMMPSLVVIMNEGRMHDALNMWQEAARKCSLIIFPCFVFFFVIGYDLMVLLYGSEYSMASWPFRIYLFSLPLRVAVYATMFRAVGQTRSIAIGAVVALVLNVVVSTTLVILGRKGIVSYIGPSIGAVVATIGSWIYLLCQLRRITSVPFSRIMRWKELGQILMVSIICGVIIFVVRLPDWPTTIKLAIQAASYFVFFLVVLLSTRMLKEDEKHMLFLPFKFLMKKFRRVKS
ncbi:MAG: oligosaccharide flippase family protein [Planctomycetes bacterium]|nr:oligosaccharide flippase family protein [Planctomycetota bacterium]